jgi:hypothetical protein
MGYSEIASWCVLPPYWRPWGDFVDRRFLEREFGINQIYFFGPCFLLCCACFFPFFQLLSMTVHQYDKWLCKTVHDLCWFDLYGQNNQLIISFILCQGNLNFCSTLMCYNGTRSLLILRSKYQFKKPNRFKKIIWFPQRCVFTSLVSIA